MDNIVRFFCMLNDYLDINDCNPVIIDKTVKIEGKVSINY